MPTYDYICDSCGHKLEATQSIKADPLTLCPKCEKNALVRGFGGGSALFQFKGDGYYITDYKKGNSSSCDCSGGHSCLSKKKESD